MTLNVFLTVIYLWLTITSVANGQQFLNAPGNFFQSQPPANPITQPNGQQNFFPRGQAPGGFGPNHQVTDPNHQIQSKFNIFPPEGPHTPEIMEMLRALARPQGATSVSPNQQPGEHSFPPLHQQTNPPEGPHTPEIMEILRALAHHHRYPQQNNPLNIGPHGPTPVSHIQQPGEHSFPPRHQQTNPYGPQQTSLHNPQHTMPYSPQQTSFYGPQRAPQQVNPYTSHQAPNQPSPYTSHQAPNQPSPYTFHQAPNQPNPYSFQQAPHHSSQETIPTYSVPQKTNPDSTSSKHIPQDPTGLHHTYTDLPGPQQGNPAPPIVSQSADSDSKGPWRTYSDSTNPPQRNSTPSIIPQPTYSSSTIPETTYSDSKSPQTTNSAPTVSEMTISSSTVPDTTYSSSTAPQTTDSGTAVSLKTDSYPTDSQTTNPASDGSQPITSASETYSSVSKAPQDAGSMPTVLDTNHQLPYRRSNRSRSEKEIRSYHHENLLGYLRIICIFNNKHYYKDYFRPSDILSHLCTHVNYEFAILDPKTYEIMMSDSDIDPVLYQEAIDLKEKHPDLKVMLSLGGWTDSTKKYSDLAADPSKRKNFIEKAIEFLKGHGFDGLDFAWEYPNCWQGAIGVSPKDKQNFVDLLSEMKPVFQKHGKLLSVSVGAIKREVEAAYDVPAISNIVDYINVMTYDMHGPWESTTGHHVQFEEMPNDKDKYCNVKGGMNVWIEKGADKKKLNMGMSSYGRTYKLKSPPQCKMGAPAEGPGAPGPKTKEGGMLDYNEICKFLNSGNWTEKEDKKAGFYACSGDQWVGYDPPAMMVRKSKFVVSSGCGGIILKYLSGDDVEGVCWNMPFPLLKMARISMVHEMKKIKKQSTSM